MDKTVYVVDDDEAVRTALVRSIGLRGYDVQVFENAEQFLENAKRTYPSCLLLDVRMPGISGMELQEKIIASDWRLPIIFITGHGDIPMSVRAVKKGAVDFLVKPYRVEALLTRIEQAIDLSGRWQEEDEDRQELLSRYSSLTQREQDVLQLLVAGAADTSNKQIARQLEISHRTVDDHRARIMTKMQARSLTELTEMIRKCDLYNTAT